MEKLIRDSYIYSLKENKNTFDVLEYNISNIYNKPCTNLYELRQKANNKKEKGDLFEEFCKIYLISLKKYNNVWLLKDVPNDILNKLGLKRVDMGIDIICNKEEEYYAYQVKFRKNNGKKRILSWKTVSTFYALCFNTGPWKNCYVITNCDYVKHGTNNFKQRSICLQTFRNISNDLWIKMYSNLNSELNTNDDNKKETENMQENININLDELRKARLKRFS